MDKQRKERLLRAFAEVPNAIVCEDDILTLCNILVAKKQLTMSQSKAIRSLRTPIKKMTQIMELVITRGNDAYDAFRDALIEINAPKHATDMLPNYSKATADKNKKPPKNSTKNSEEGGSSSHHYSKSRGDNGFQSDLVKQLRETWLHERANPYEDRLMDVSPFPRRSDTDALMERTLAKWNKNIFEPKE